MTKYMNDPEVKCQSRLIACMLAPEAEAASRVLVELRDAKTTLQYFCSPAQHIALLEDVQSLGRIGLHMQWSQDLSAGRLEYDTATTQKLFSFLRAMLKYRGGSNLWWHTWGPGAVAGLLSAQEAKVRSSLLLHRNLFDAVNDVRRTDNDVFFGHVFHVLRLEDWREVSATAQNFLTSVFSRAPNKARGFCKASLLSPVSCIGRKLGQ